MRLSFIQGVLVMETKLVPIYALRMLMLERLNPQFFAANADMILRTSLAAQDYILSGQYYEYDPRTGRLFRKLPGYISIHKKYNLPYDPETSTLIPQSINPGLVMDLSWSFQTDKLNGIIDDRGNIRDTKRLGSSEVLQVYHNSSASGTPINALYKITKSQFEAMVASTMQTKTK